MMTLTDGGIGTPPHGSLIHAGNLAQYDGLREIGDGMRPGGERQTGVRFAGDGVAQRSRETLRFRKIVIKSSGTNHVPKIGIVVAQHWQATGHRFDQHDAEHFEQRWHDKQVGGPVKLFHLLPGNVDHETNRVPECCPALSDDRIGVGFSSAGDHQQDFVSARASERYGVLS